MVPKVSRIGSVKEPHGRNREAGQEGRQEQGKGGKKSSSKGGSAKEVEKAAKKLLK